MSDSDNRFGARKPAPGKQKKPAQAKRGFANVVRRDQPSEGGRTAKKSSNEASPRRGVAHVVARRSAHAASEDSAVLLTPPNITVPLGKAAQMAGSSRFNALQTNDGDEYTVEEGRPLPPSALLAIAEKKLVGEVNRDPGQGFLIVTSGNDLGRRVPLIEGRTTIGRGMDNDIVLTDIAVSRRHMYIERRDNVYFVCDLSSGNGTFVNDKERSGEVLIVNGDSFRIGNTVVSFTGPEAQQDDEAGSTTDWRPEPAGGKRRRATGEEESTVAGKGIFRKREGTQDDPVTQAPTHVAPSVELSSDLRQPPTHLEEPPSRKRAPTGPPPMPPSLASVQDAAIAAVSSIVATPPAEESAIYPLDSSDLPNLSVPPTPSPAIPYPLAAPAQLSPRMTAKGMPPGAKPSRQPMPRQPIATMGAMPGGLAPGQHPGHGQGQHPMHGQGQHPMHGQGQHPMHGQGQGPMPMGMPGPGSGPMQMPLSQGSGPLPAGLGPAPMGYPGPMGQPMLGHMPASGEIRGYSYESPRYQPVERGKLLIGIIAVALVLVVVGIVAAVMGQKEGETSLAATGTETATGTGTETETETGTETGTGTGTDTGTETGTGTDSATETGTGTGTDTGTETGTGTDTGTETATETETETGTETETETETAQPILVASLIAGNTSMPASTWGTDESFLTDIPEVSPVPAPIVEPVEPEEPEEPAKEPEPKRDPPAANTRSASTRSTNKRPSVSKRPSRSNSDSSDDDEDSDLTDDDQESSAPSKGSSKGVAAATAEAKSLYKRRKFDEAADVLNRAADRASDKESDKLLDMATSFKQVGQLLSSAEKVQNTDPASALDSYKQALSKDKRVGGAEHGNLIRLRIGQVAPKAARSFMAKGRLAEAKKAADDAARYNEGDAVKAVYDSLERKADKLVEEALEAKEKGSTDRAKALLLEATRIAPRDTEAYQLSRNELKKL